MSQEIARRALHIFEQALEVSKEELSDFVSKSCQDNQELRDEVESLLAANQDSSELLPTVYPTTDSTASAAKAIKQNSGSGKRLDVGTILGDRYEIVSVLGSGGMGEVYRARDNRLDRDVAIKILNLASFADLEMQVRFDREMKSVASIFHPNIVTLFDVADHGDLKFAIMELVEGKTVRELIADGIDWQSVVRLGRGLATGLSVAHAQNIMHRDIKPENVIVSHDGHPKILDFGLARSQTPYADQEVTGNQLVPGTIPYMSPEQANAEDLTCATDVFSLGTVFFEMLTGTNPFRGSSLVETMQNVCSASPPSISEYVNDTPDKLVSLVLSMLHRNPNRRPTAKEIVDDLGGMDQLADSPATAPESGLNTSHIGTSVPTNLPLRPIELTGRGHAVATISSCLANCAIVTVLGPGGVGKTSIALAVARAKLDAFPGGVWLCEFASVRDSDNVAEVIAATLDGNAGSMSRVDEMVGRLLGAPTLLILDNCEHVIDAVADLAETLSSRVPNLTVLATSRESLDVGGEFVHRLDGLDFSGETSPAADLFVERATALTGYKDEVARRTLIEQIVSRLEGLPLAIELAAAKLSALSLEELLEALDDQVTTLRSRRRSRSRQDAIDTTIAWSFDLLEAEEQKLLLQLSVFVASFTIDAAVAVSGQTSAKQALQRLVDQSVLVRKERKGVSRYRLLEPIRQFCQSRIQDDLLQTARKRHAYFYAQRAKLLGKGFFGFDEIKCSIALNEEWPDLRQAVAWGRQFGVVEVAVDPVIAIDKTLMFHLRVEGYRWLMLAEEQFGDDLSDRADVWWVIANGAWVMGELQKAEDYIRRSESVRPTSQAFGVKYFLRFAQQRFDESYEAAVEALRLAIEANDECERRWWSNAQTACPLALGYPDDTRIDGIIQNATSAISKHDWPSGEAFLYLAKATSAMTRGNLDQAFKFRQRSISVAESCGNRWIALINRLVIDDGLDPSVSPRDHLATAVKNLRTLIELGEEAHYPLAVRAVIMALISCKRFDTAVRSSAVVDGLSGVGDKEEFTPNFRPTMAKLAAQLGDVAFNVIRQEAAGTTVLEVLELAEQCLLD